MGTTQVALNIGSWNDVW